MPTCADIDSVKDAAPKQGPRIKGDQGFVQPLVSERAGSAFRSAVIDHIGVHLELEVLQDLPLGSQAQATNLVKGLRLVVAIHSVYIGGGELHLGPAEELHRLDQHGIVV